MSRFLSLVLVVVLGCIAQGRLHAQDVMVPFDEAGTVFVYTLEMQRSMDLFPDVQNLREVRIWRTQDSVYTLEITAGSDAMPMRTRRPISMEELTRLRSDFARLRGQSGKPDLFAGRLDQSGRPSILWGSTLLGAVYYGTALGFTVFGDSFGDNRFTTALPYLFAGVAGFGLPYTLTKNAVITKGDASLMNTALVLGPATGWGLSTLVLGDNITNGDNYRIGFGFSMVTGVAGAFAAYKFSRSRNLTEGHANVISSSTLFGSAIGFCASAIVGDLLEPSEDMLARSVSGLALAGAAAGFAAGNAIGGSQPYSAGDATSYAITTTLTGLLPLAVISSLQPNNLNASLVAGATALSIMGGMYLGDMGVQGRDYTGDEAQYMLLGAAGGYLVGLGVSVMTASSSLTPLIMLGGSALGYTIVKASFADDAKARATSMGSTDLQWNVNPAAPMMASTLPGVSVPFVSLSGRF